MSADTSIWSIRPMLGCLVRVARQPRPGADVYGVADLDRLGRSAAPRPRSGPSPAGTGRATTAGARAAGPRRGLVQLRAAPAGFRKIDCSGPGLRWLFVDEEPEQAEAVYRLGEFAECDRLAEGAAGAAVVGAPARSSSSFDEVSTTTGMRRVRSSALIRRRTSSPPTLGSFRSSRTNPREKCSSSSPKSRARASAPSRATVTGLSRLFFLRARIVRVAIVGVVLDEQDLLYCSWTAFWVEGEVDGNAAVDGAICPGPAAVALDDAADAGQADAGAG